MTTELEEQTQAADWREQLLARAGHLLAESLDLSATLSKVARLAIPALADGCIIELLESDGIIRPVAVAHADPLKEEAVRRVRQLYEVDANEPQGIAKVLRTGKAECYPGVSEEGLAEYARDDEHLRLLRLIAPRSAMIAPLTARGRTFGGITFLMTEPGRSFQAEDFSFAADLAERAARAVDTAALYDDSVRIEKQLRRQLDFTTAITDNIGESVWGTDPEGIVIFANPAAQAALGWPEGETIGKSLLAVFAVSGGGDEFASALRLAITGGAGTGVRGEAILTRRDGIPLAVAYCTSSLAVGGKPGGAVVSFHDVGALHESEQRFRSVFEVSREGIVVESAGNIAYANPAFASMFGYDQPSQFSGQPISAFFEPAERERLTEFGRRRIAGEDAPAEYETRGRRRDGSVFDLEFAVSSYKAGGQTTIVALARDVSGRKRIEAELERRIRHHAAVAELGQMALSETSFGKLLQSATKHLARTLEIEYVAVFELLADGETLRMRAGTGWNDGVIGEATVTKGTESQAGYALMTEEPVLVEDVAAENRFNTERLCSESRAASGLSVVIPGPGRPFGVLQVHSLVPHRFGPDDLNFLQSVANVIGAASDRLHADEALGLQTSYFTQLFESSPSGIVITDNTERILDANPGFERLFGYKVDEIRGRNLNELIAPEDLREEAIGLSRDVGAGGVVHRDTVRRRKDGSVVDVAILGYPIMFGGRQIGVYGIYSDITERRHAEETIRHQAYHDALTGLPNRLLFSDRLTMALAHARRSKQMLAVLFLDLDRFKIINDTLGHAVGDELLEALAKRLLPLVRDEDTVARGGGDEFTILLAQINMARDAAGIAQKILECLRPPFSCAGRELHVTASVGISLYPYDGDDGEALLKNADTAMYRAKDQGRNNYRFYTPGMNAKAFERLALENNLRQALDRGEFVVYYQPQRDIHDGRLVGMEALVRWQHPDLGLIYPGEFIHLAEETGLITQLGEWVLRHACLQSKAWQRAGFQSLRMAVNLSARQLQQPNLLDSVIQILDDTELEPGCLELEITESIAMQNPDLTLLVLHGLREMGIQISLDDFGTGYSSLGYLKRFPLNTLKIDQSFVRDLTVDSADEAIVAAMITLGHGLKLKVIAEGVESEEELQILRSLKCDYMQGYLFSRPLPADSLVKLISG